MWKGLLGAFLKHNCALCDRANDNYICQYCEQKLRNCQIADSCHSWKGDLPLFAWGAYSGALKRAIATMKYHGHPEVGEVLGLWLGECWRKSRLFQSYPRLVVIAIPLHPQKLRERGFNQAELIAEGFSQATGYRLLRDGLRRVKDTQPLFTLDLQGRQRELHQAFCLGQDLSGKLAKKQQIILIDDIYTTGTTAQESTQLLRQQGLPVVGIGAIAKPL